MIRTCRRAAGTLLAGSLVAAGLLATATTAHASFPSATNGRIFFEGISDINHPVSQIYSINPDGSDLEQLTTSGDNLGPDVSADGSRVVFGSNRGGNYEIWSMRPDGSDQTQVTHDGASDYYPAFSPDGTQIAYRMTTDTNPGDIFLANSDGTGTPTRLTTAPGLDSVAEWKDGPDGGLIVFHSNRDDADPANCSSCVQSLYTMKPDGSDQTQIVHVPGGKARFANWSPDGTKIVYEHDSSTDYQNTSNEIWTADADGSNQQVFAPTAGAFNDEAPDFSPDGTQLVWEANGDMQMAAFDDNATVRDIDTGGLDVGSIDWSVSPASVLTSNTTLTLTPTSSVYGQPVVARAKVTSAGGVTATPTGTVTFAVNGAAVGAPVPLKKGVAAKTLTTPPTGSDVVTATYNGDAQHTASHGRVILPVYRAATSVTPSVADGGDLTYGQPLTATVSVQSPSKASVPSGLTGYAYVDGNLYDSLAVRNARITVPASALPAGSHSVQICVNTSADLSGSCSDFFTVNVDQVQATVTLTSNANPATAGQKVTLTATVAPTATGSVDFFDDGGYLGSAQVTKGRARLKTTFGSGTHPLTAVYSGDGNYTGATSDEYDQQVS